MLLLQTTDMYTVLSFTASKKSNKNSRKRVNKRLPFNRWAKFAYIVVRITYILGDYLVPSVSDWQILFKSTLWVSLGSSITGTVFDGLAAKVDYNYTACTAFQLTVIHPSFRCVSYTDVGLNTAFAHYHQLFIRRIPIKLSTTVLHSNFLPELHYLTFGHLVSQFCLSPVFVCNILAPYSAGWNFRQCFYAVLYIA